MNIFIKVLLSIVFFIFNYNLSFAMEKKKSKDFQPTASDKELIKIIKENTRYDDIEKVVNSFSFAKKQTAFPLGYKPSCHGNNVPLLVCLTNKTLQGKIERE